LSLPHRFPFRLIDDTQGARARFALTLTSYWLREGGTLPIGLLVEAMAQAAALLLRDPGAPEGDRLLAGLEGVQCPRPLRCGDRLEIEAALEARLGGAARVSTRVYRDGEEVARGTLLLAAV
jgi:3-hydroxymyristoyl/3-hydroxydecanoyl-(acyl carrier protein) dehydratase